MILDAGQKDIGVKICDECDMIYTAGQEEDEKLHSDYHNKYLGNLKFSVSCIILFFLQLANF